MQTVLGEDVTESETAPTDEMVATEIMQMPVVGAQRSVKPDRVIKAGKEESRQAGFRVRLVVDLRCDRMTTPHGITG